MAPSVRTCSTMAVHHRLLLTEPDYAQARAESENRAFQARDVGSGRAGVATIPVVVHVVYKTPEQNLDIAQVSSQIDVLNRDFRKTNTDIGEIPPPFKPLASDSRVEFKLATTDPDGKTTDGVTRTETQTDSFSDDDAVKSSKSGGADAWPADRYLNLWVCELGSGLL